MKVIDHYRPRRGELWLRLKCKCVVGPILGRRGSAPAEWPCRECDVALEVKHRVSQKALLEVIGGRDSEAAIRAGAVLGIGYGRGGVDAPEITITLVPRGQEDAAQIVGSLYIENIGGSDDLGEYSYVLYGKAAMDGAMPKRLQGRDLVVANGRLMGFPRKKRSVWHLLSRILRHHFKEGA